MAGEGPGAGAVAVVGKEFSVIRGPRTAAVVVWPGKYDADYLRSMIGNRAFSDLIGIGDVRLESE